jgi:hypothetical protein
MPKKRRRLTVTNMLSTKLRRRRSLKKLLLKLHNLSLYKPRAEWLV